MANRIGSADINTKISPDSSAHPGPVAEKSGQQQHLLEVHRVHGEGNTTQSTSTSTDFPWQPSLLRVGALSGLAALALAFLLVFVEYGILKASDGQPLERWGWQPTVYLAILVAISNKALAFATVQGVAVSWWLQVMKGTTIGQLHRNWVRPLTFTFEHLRLTH